MKVIYKDKVYTVEAITPPEGNKGFIYKIMGKDVDAKECKIVTRRKCRACSGTGYVEGEHYDDLQGCNNCLGSGGEWE